MRKFWIGAVFTLLVTASAVADQINFNFTVGAPTSVTATNATGLMSGPSFLTSISDTTTNTVIPCTGPTASPVCMGGSYVNGKTGPGTITATPPVVVAFFTAGGANSVLVEDATSMMLVAGSMNDSGALLSTVPAGAGSFLGTFGVSSVSPAVLGLFGLGGAAVKPTGSVALTFANANFDGTTFTAAIGGGSVTIQTEVVPEPASLGLVGIGFLTVAGGLWKRTHRSPR